MESSSSTPAGGSTPRRRISRRKFLGAAAVAGAGAVAGGIGLGLSRRRGKRNVILIISDSMRRDALSCYGSRWCHTPHLDSFAQRALRCDNAYVCSFPTIPTRRDILTGDYTYCQPPWLMPFKDRTITLQDVLGSAGVYTSLIVDTPHPYTQEYEFHRNFDCVHFNHGQEGDKTETRPLPVHLPCDPKKLRAGTEMVTQYLRNVAGRKGEEDYFCARTMRDAAAWLEKNHRRQPFFLYLDTFDPHEPWDPPRSYIQQYDPDYTGEEVIYPRYDRWRDYLTPRELQHCRALYAAKATMVDHWIGHLLERIERLGLLENTMVMLVADHGIYLGEHGYMGKMIVRANQIQMLPLYGELCRIPLLVHYPGCRAGTVIDGLVQPVHLGRTVLDFLGIAAPHSFRAPSAWPLFQGKTDHVTKVAVSSPLFPPDVSVGNRLSDRVAATDGQWLFVCGPFQSGPDGGETNQRPPLARLTHEPMVPELYDLKTDPGCLQNVIAQHEERAHDLQRHVMPFIERNRTWYDRPLEL